MMNKEIRYEKLAEMLGEDVYVTTVGVTHPTATDCLSVPLPEYGISLHLDRAGDLREQFVIARQAALLEWERRRTADFRFTLIKGKVSDDFRFMACDRGREEGDKIVAKCKTELAAILIIQNLKQRYIKGEDLDGFAIHGETPPAVLPENDHIPEDARCENEQRDSCL